MRISTAAKSTRNIAVQRNALDQKPIFSILPHVIEMARCASPSAQRSLVTFVGGLLRIAELKGCTPYCTLQPCSLAVCVLWRAYGRGSAASCMKPRGTLSIPSTSRRGRQIQPTTYEIVFVTIWSFGAECWRRSAPLSTQNRKNRLMTEDRGA